jgi:hypothetical protein
MAKDTMTELTPYPGSAGMYQNLLDDRYQYIVFASEDGNNSQLVCRMSSGEDLDSGAAPPSEDESNQYEDQHNMPPGSISGTIYIETDETPAMRICAIYDNGAAYGCTRTKAGQKTYRIDYLPAADYVVVAEFTTEDKWLGGHTNGVRCTRAPCPASELITVPVSPGEKRTGIDISDFSDKHFDWPALPADDGA